MFMLMQKSLLVFSTVIFFSISVKAQNELKYNNPPVESKGTTLQINFVPLYRYFHDDLNNQNSIYAELKTDASVWKYSDKLNYIGYSYITTEYEKGSNNTVDSYNSSSRITAGGALYANGGYYFTPNKFYVSASFGSRFDYSKEFDGNYSFIDKDYSNTIWLTAGYGRIY